MMMQSVVVEKVLSIQLLVMDLNVSDSTHALKTHVIEMRNVFLMAIQNKIIYVFVRKASTHSKVEQKII
jgi:hypothetical protein